VPPIAFPSLQETAHVYHSRVSVDFVEDSVLTDVDSKPQEPALQLDRIVWPRVYVQIGDAPQDLGSVLGRELLDALLDLAVNRDFKTWRIFILVHLEDR
jgi:hypothetical protein